MALSAEDEVIAADTLSLVMEVLGSLGDRSMEIYLAHHQDGVSIRDLAISFGTNEGAIRNRLNRAQTTIDGRVQSGRLGLEK